MKNLKKMKRMKTYTVIRKKEYKNKMIKKGVNQMEKTKRLINQEQLKMGIKRINNRLLKYYFKTTAISNQI